MIQKAGYVLEIILSKYYWQTCLLMSFLFALVLTGGYFLGGLDGGLYMLSDEPVHLYTWFEGTLGGTYSTNAMHSLLYIFRLLFVNIYFYQIAFYTFLFFVCFIGIRLINQNLAILGIKDIKNNTVLFIVTLFYLFNPISITYRLPAVTANAYMFYGVPFFLGLVFWYLKYPNLKNAVFANLGILLISFIWLNTPGILGLIIFAILIFFLLKKESIKIILVFLLICILLNSYWILPFLQLFGDSLNHSLSAIDTKANIEYLSSILGWKNVLFFYPSEHWGAIDTYRGYYRNIFIEVVSITFIGITILYFLLLERKNLKYLRVLIIFLIFLDISSPSGITSIIVKNYYGSFPILGSLRTAYDKMVYFPAILLLIILGRVLLENNNIYNSLLYVYLVINVIPFISGGLFFSQNGYQTRLKIPKFYFTQEIKSLSQLSGRILILPLYRYDRTVTNWKYNGLDPFMAYQGNFLAAFTDNNPMTKKLYDEIQKGIYNKQTFKKLGINYIFIRPDANINDLKELESFINKFSNEDNSRKYSNNLYAVNNLPLLIGQNLDYFKSNPVNYSFSLKYLSGVQDLYMLEAFHPQWKLYLEPYENISCSTKREALLHMQKEKNNIMECTNRRIFYKGGEISKLWKQPIFENTHTKIYNYANQWTIDSDYIKKNYSTEYYKENSDGSIDIRLTLYFRPQSYFYFGLIISGSTITLLLLYLSIVSIRKRKNKIGKIQ